ncbi:MAG: hypothetical protein JWP03_5161, partial [Phycisphaerales bacterium]|nr:hypothetical protein [Phycisphaerales bacterium]
MAALLNKKVPAVANGAAHSGPSMRIAGEQQHAQAA